VESNKRGSLLSSLPIYPPQTLGNIDAKINVRLKFLNRERQEMLVDREERVGSLKEKIAEQINTAPESIIIEYQGKAVTYNEIPLRELNKKDGCINVHVIDKHGFIDAAVSDGTSNFKEMNNVFIYCLQLRNNVK
jgi:hypothetical protein